MSAPAGRIPSRPRSGGRCGRPCARFTEREVVPHLDDWERAGEVPRSLHEAAAAAGLLGIGFAEEVGGSGGDLLDLVVLTEELIQAGGSSGLVAALLTHGIAVPHLVAAGDPAQLDRFVRPTLAGRRIGALAVTEPDGGSDVAALRTRAVRDGDCYRVTGTKTYITSGARADFVTTAVRTGGPGHEGISLLVIERGHARLHRRAAAGEDGLALLGHRRAVLRRTARCRRPTWSAPRAPASPRPCTTSSGSGSRSRCRRTRPRSAAWT